MYVTEDCIALIRAVHRAGGYGFPVGCDGWREAPMGHGLYVVYAPDNRTSWLFTELPPHQQVATTPLWGHWWFWVIINIAPTIMWVVAARLSYRNKWMPRWHPFNLGVEPEASRQANAILTGFFWFPILIWYLFIVPFKAMAWAVKYPTAAERREQKEKEFKEQQEEVNQLKAKYDLP